MVLFAMILTICFSIWELVVPTISMFYGIIISLYFYDNERHKLPHIHAKYQGQDASFSILDGSFWLGRSLFPKRDWFRHG